MGRGDRRSIRWKRDRIRNKKLRDKRASEARGLARKQGPVAPTPTPAPAPAATPSNPPPPPPPSSAATPSAPDVADAADAPADDAPADDGADQPAPASS
ncbi:MAG TPA: hypothetical protein VI916_03975 [Acidimicrobiia bacterium]|nr:hypothetical protein [Acidimicrobiia bacterium]